MSVASEVQRSVLGDIAVDEYLAEVTGECTGIPDDAKYIMDWVFGCEDVEDDCYNDDEQSYEEEQSDSH